jgi:hypothetical protein
MPKIDNHGARFANERILSRVIGLCVVAGFLAICRAQDAERVPAPGGSFAATCDSVQAYRSSVYTTKAGETVCQAVVQGASGGQAQKCTTQMTNAVWLEGDHPKLQFGSRASVGV